MKMILRTRGRTQSWNFIVDVNPNHIIDYLTDGLDIQPHIGCTWSLFPRWLNGLLDKLFWHPGYSKKELEKYGFKE